MLAGVAGGLHAVALRGIGQSTYPASMSLLVFSMAVIGGVSSLGGTLAGVALVQWAGYLFPKAQLFLTGVGLLAILLVIPGGLAQAFEHWRDRFVRVVARRHGLVSHDEVETVEQAVEPDTAAPSTATPRAPGCRVGSVRRERLGAHLLTCDGLEASYGSLQVLFGIDMGVERNELLALLGTNGAGKSTVLKSIAGLLPAGKGKVTFDGRDITHLPAEEIARLGLSLMPGGKGVFPTLTVAENLRLACWMLRHDPDAAQRMRDETVRMFPILGERHDQLAGDLSGGEQQQLSLAMAFVTRPKLLCIDELSLGLAPTVVDRLVDKVREIHAHGTTVVVVEQSVNVALLLCHRAVFLEKGQVRFRGPTAGLLDRPDILRAVFIGADANGHAPGAGIPAAPQAVPPPWERPSRGVTLEARGITKRFGGIRALDDVHLTIHPATIVGLIGHNGAGKTTLFDVLTGFLPADGGQVLLDGVDITRWPPHRRAIAEVGRTFQEALLYPSLSVEDAVAVSLEQHLANRDPLAAALRLPASLDSEASARERVDQLVDLLGLAPVRRPAHRRAVDRHAAHRRAGVPAGAGPGRRAAGRAVGRDRPARDRGARPAAAPGAGRDRVLVGRHRARHGAAVVAVRRVRGARAGCGDRRRHARAGAVEPPGHQLVPRHQRGRGPPLGRAARLVLLQRRPAPPVVTLTRARPTSRTGPAAAPRPDPGAGPRRPRPAPRRGAPATRPRSRPTGPPARWTRGRDRW